MKRKILTNSQKSEVQLLSSVTPRTSDPLTKGQIEKNLRQKRSPSYIEALHQLDAGGHICSTDTLNKVIAAIKSELPEMIVEQLLLGIVSKCYLRHFFEVHTLQITGNIIHHYRTGESLPPALEKARSLAKHSSYILIEVYSSYMVAVSQDGSSSLITLDGDNNNE